MSNCIKRIFCCLLLLGVFIQVVYPQKKWLSFSHLSLINNLHPQVLMRDSKGFLWIGSDGLFQYDGVGIRRFIHDPKNNNSLVSNIVKSLVEDKKGRIWIGTIKGISCYDPATGSFTNYEYDGNDRNHPRARFDNVLYIDKDSILWSGDQSGINRYDDQKSHFILYDLAKYQLPGHRKGNFITHIIDDNKKKGWLWLTSYDGLIHFNKVTGFAQYYYPPGPVMTINSITGDSHERLWLSTWGQGLGFFNETNGRFSFFPFEKNAHMGSDNIVFSVKEQIITKDSSLFFINTNRGLTLLDLRDLGNIHYGPFYMHKSDDEKSIGGIPSETMIDKQGIIWVATGNDISYILPAAQEFHQVKSTGLSDALVNTITEEELPDGHYQYWLSCWYADGLKLCGEDFLPKPMAHFPVKYANSVDSKQINKVIIEPRTRNVWIATMDGLFKWNRDKNTVKVFRQEKSIPYSLPSSQIMCMLMDHQKRLWTGTYHNGLCLLNTIDNTFIKLPSGILNTFKDKHILCIYQDSKSRIWIGGGGGGVLLRINEKGDDYQIYVHHKGDLKSKADGDVNSIVEDKNGAIWIGNDEGLNRYNEATNDFELFTTVDGLSNDHIYTLVRDKDGLIWIGTPSGLNSLNPVTKSIKSFYEKDGLLTNDVSNALFIAHNNIVVAAGTQGAVTLFNPQKIYRNTAQPPVYITSLKLFNKIDNHRSAFPLPKEISLSYNENYFSIDFIALNLMNPGDNKYAYQLTGLDKNWIQSGTDHTVTYSNLGAGKYVFKVKASNNDNVWNNQGASLMITITPPFWKTWWFILICIIMLIVIVYIIYNYRLEQLLQVERLRTKISTDLHDDIGSTLSSISILSELVLNRKDKEQTGEMLAEIKDNAISLMEKMDDIVWSINPKNDSLEDLLSRITRFAVQLFEAKNIDHTISIQPDIKDLKLPMEVRQHLYLMIKETINNIIKHAGCTKASIDATCKDQLLTIVISDNGKGFQTENNSSGNGLINLKERATRMGANVSIDSQLNNGTNVIIDLKIK